MLPTSYESFQILFRALANAYNMYTRCLQLASINVVVVISCRELLNSVENLMLGTS